MQLVAVPGIGLDQRSLEGVLNQISKETALPYKVVHLPGMGRKGAASVGENAEELIREVGAEEVVLVGHSASCQVVARAAAELDVRALVLIGPTTDPRKREWSRLGRAWAETAAHEPLWQLPLLLRQYSNTGMLGMWKTMNLARREKIEEDLSRLKVPLLVLRGEKDRIADPEWSRSCADLGDVHSWLRTLPGAHLIVQTHPERVAREIIRFLDQTVQQPEERKVQRPH